MNDFNDWLDEDNVPEPIAAVFSGATKIPTTDEMDGLFTEVDKASRHKIMMQCTTCYEWTENEEWKPSVPCTGCGSRTYDSTSTISLRTFNPLTARKRRPKAKR